MCLNNVPEIKFEAHKIKLEIRNKYIYVYSIYSSKMNLFHNHNEVPPLYIFLVS